MDLPDLPFPKTCRPLANVICWEVSPTGFRRSKSPIHRLRRSMRARNFSWSPRHLTLVGDQEGVGKTPCHSPFPRIVLLARWCVPGALLSTFAAETSLSLYHNWQLCWRVHENLSSPTSLHDLGFSCISTSIALMAWRREFIATGRKTRNWN